MEFRKRDYTPREVVDAILDSTPDHKPGTRPVHAIGIAVKGQFVASQAARRYCIAEHFQGQDVPVTVRFSNGSGGEVEHDGWSDVRGMATRFHLGHEDATDLIMMTLGNFFVQNMDQFMAFTRAAHPSPYVPETVWQKIKDMLNMRPPLPAPNPGQRESNGEALLEYANENDFARLAVYRMGSIGAPVSYARAYYHAVNTFVAIDPSGLRRHVRFEWQPVSGVRKTDPEKPPVDKYLHAELRRRLGHWPVRFLLNMTIGETGDNLTDPSRPWPKRRTKIGMGTLILDDVAKDQEAEAERIAFNPCRLTPGLEMSDDPILRARKDVYETSREMRGGTPCPFHDDAGSARKEASNGQ